MAAIQTSVVVLLRELAFRVTQIGKSCSDTRVIEELTQLSSDMMERASDYEALLAIPANR